MRIFAIKDESAAQERILGYLIYHELSKTFHIELSDGVSRWDVPAMLSSFADRGDYSVDSHWSRRFVHQRIVPQDRQNIGQILRENGLNEYDEFPLLMLSMGRCEQDDCYLEEISSDKLPELLIRRWYTLVEEVVPLASPKLLVFFRNGAAKIVDAEETAPPACTPYLINQERFNKVEVQPDGYGIYWNDQAMIPHQDLFRHGVSIPLSAEVLSSFLQNRVVSASEACSILDCSRQNIDDLMRRGKLHPLRTDAKYKLFSRAEVMARKKE